MGDTDVELPIASSPLVEDPTVLADAEEPIALVTAPRRHMAEVSGDGKNLTLSLDTGMLWWNAGLSSVQGNVHLELANQLSEPIAYYDMYANVSYGNFFKLDTTLTNNSGLYEGTLMSLVMDYETTDRSLTAIDVTLGDANGPLTTLFSHTLDSYAGRVTYELGLDYTVLKTTLGLSDGQVVWLRVGYRNQAPLFSYSVKVAYKDISSFAIDDPICIYRGSCRVRWTSNNPCKSQAEQTLLYLLVSQRFLGSEPDVSYASPSPHPCRHDGDPVCGQHGPIGHGEHLHVRRRGVQRPDQRAAGQARGGLAAQRLAGHHEVQGRVRAERGLLRGLHGVPGLRRGPGRPDALPKWCHGT